MGWVPPKLMDRPDWMSDDEWRSIVSHEIEMLERMRLRAGHNAKAAAYSAATVLVIVTIIGLLVSVL